MVVLCELCRSSQAKYHCESDRADLCMDCDAKVHGANFLVAKHSRSVLCQICQSPTPWKASGSRLPPSFSLCISCSSPAITRLPSLSPHFQTPVLDLDRHQLSNLRHDEFDNSQDCNDEEDDSEEEQGYFSRSDYEDEDESEDDENQVVPSTPDTKRIRESEEEERIGVILQALKLKRKRDMAFSHS